MKVSQRGLELIKKYEGFFSEAYLCPSNIPTIAYGCTVYPNGEKVKLGDKISQSEGLEILEKQVNEHSSTIPSYVKIPLNQNQFDALASFQYNLGKHILSKDKVLANYINNEDWNNVIRIMGLYIKGNGKVLQGLIKRRKEEIELFLTPIKSNGGENVLNFIKPTEGLVTSFFSPQRKNPVTGILKPHTGADIGWYGTDDKVVAMASGKVVVPRYSNTAGNYIWIEHGNGYTTVYSHLKSISVRNGQQVKQGQIIGIKGATGNSSGVHLHFEVIKHNTFTNDWSKKLNPLLFFIDNTTKEWQLWLKELGYYNGVVDGIYGDGTIKAVLDYQKKNKLSADGVCGRGTYAHIKNSHSKLSKETISKPASPPPSSSKPNNNIKEERVIKLLKDATSATLRNEFVKELEQAYKDGVFTDKKWIEQAKSGEMSLADAFLLNNRINKNK